MESSSLSSLVEQLKNAKPSGADDASQWKAVEAAARTIANELRVRNGPVDYHTTFGEAGLPQVIATLLALATNNGAIPASAAASAAAFELLRVSANLCSDHDQNRQLLLDANVTTLVSKILDAYWGKISATKPGEVSLDDLKLIRTGIGFLLNATVGYEPVRTSLVASGVPLTILRLSSTLYIPGGWVTSPASAAEEWNIRNGLASWSWKAIDQLKGGDDVDTDHPPVPQRESKNDAIFDETAIPSLVNSLLSFVPPYTSEPAIQVQNGSDFVDVDLEVLQQVSMLLESLCMDSPQFCLKLATKPSLPTAHPPLASLIDFIEKAAPPPYWSSYSATSAQLKQWTSTLAFCKAAIIKAITTVAGEDKNLPVLWDEKAQGFPGGWFVEKMVSLVKNVKLDEKNDNERDDLVICATISLGNLARNATNCVALVAPPISIAPHLLPLLAPKVDIKVKHGTVGLLKHLSQPGPNKTPIGDAGFIDGLAKSGIWKPEGDIADSVQMSAIGVAKHLSYGSYRNAIRLISPPTDAADVDSALDQILDLVKRSDMVSLQSEGTRVLVNVVKSLFAFQFGSANGASPHVSVPPSPVSGRGPIDERERREAIARISTLDSTEPLAEMIGRSGKYNILLIEGILALTLLSSTPDGVLCVLQSLLAPLPYRITDAGVAVALPPAPAESSNKEPQGSCPVDMLVAILRNQNGNFPPELGANTCSLLSSVIKGPPDDLAKVKKAVTPVLKTLAESSMDVDVTPTSGSQIVIAAAKRTLTAWGPA